MIDVREAMTGLVGVTILERRRVRDDIRNSENTIFRNVFASNSSQNKTIKRNLPYLVVLPDMHRACFYCVVGHHPAL